MSEDILGFQGYVGSSVTARNHRKTSSSTTVEDQATTVDFYGDPLFSSNWVKDMITFTLSTAVLDLPTLFFSLFFFLFYKTIIKENNGFSTDRFSPIAVPFLFCFVLFRLLLSILRRW